MNNFALSPIIERTRIGCLLGTLIVSFGAGPLHSIQAASQTAAPTLPRPDAVVSADGAGTFKKVQDAVNAAPAGGKKLFLIQIKPGRYPEKITIPKEKCPIKFQGEDAAATVLTFGDYADKLDAEGVKIGTIKTPSTSVLANDFAAENITFENSFGTGSQALAVAVSGDRAVFRKCRFIGWQDTILLNEGRQFFENCYIAGHVDFIFGAATAFFDHCEIHSRAHGYLTAASTPQGHPFGFVFSHCTITAEPDAETKKTYLGRPWRPFASVTFLHTEMPGAIQPAGWDNWRNPENEKTARFAEYRSTGLGGKPDGRVPWSKQLTDEEASALTAFHVLGNWDPNGVVTAERIATLPAGEFYDVASNRPFFAGAQDGMIYDSFEAMWQHNGFGYDYYTSKPEELLTKDQVKWRELIASSGANRPK